MEEDVLEKLDENLPLMFEYSAAGKTCERASHYKLGEFLDDNPQLLDVNKRMKKPLAALSCVVRARFMQFPSTLRLLVRYPHKHFPRIIQEKTVVEFSFNINGWGKVLHSIHTFENTSFKEFVNHTQLMILDSTLPLVMVTTVGGRVTEKETDFQLSDLLAYMLEHRRG